MSVTASDNGRHDSAHRHHGGGHHGHTHSHGRAARSRRRLTVVLVLTAVYMVAEAVGGWATGSLALLADAGHMLTDVAALALALIAVW
ncbi:MAG TPA: cation transporter, partial [Pyrinomonadaceae bacterium]|nr:cation transporter [Pyrinomonadaceae bacterium]